MTDWQLLWPWVWLLLPLPWLAWRLLPARRPGMAIRLPYQRLEAASQSRATGSRLTLVLLTLAWLPLLLAASRPQQLGPPLPQSHSGRSLLLVVDLSGSMRVRDMEIGGEAVNRLQAVKVIMGDFIQRRQGDSLGLVLFGSHAYLVTPLTYDLSAVRAQLESSRIGIAGKKTAIGDALAIASKRLLERPKDQRVIILLTDGVNTSGRLTPQAAAAAAKQAGVRIYTIGIGANRLQVPGLFGSRTINPSANLNVKLLTHIATQTGGQFFRATSSESLAKAYQAIDQLEPTKQRGKVLRLPQEAFQWPLLLALACLCLAWLSGRFRGAAS